MEPKKSSREETTDNESPPAQVLIVMYGRNVLIYMKWLLLRLLLLEFDFEKKKIFFLLTANFIMPFVFFGQVTRYLKHPAASLLQINSAFCFPLPRPDPCLPCYPHLSHVSIFVGSAGERGNHCGGFKGDNLVFVDILLLVSVLGF